MVGCHISALVERIQPREFILVSSKLLSGLIRIGEQEALETVRLYFSQAYFGFSFKQIKSTYSINVAINHLKMLRVHLLVNIHHHKHASAELISSPKFKILYILSNCSAFPLSTQTLETAIQHFVIFDYVNFLKWIGVIICLSVVTWFHEVYHQHLSVL